MPPIGGQLPFGQMQANAGMLSGLGGSPQQAMASLGQNYTAAYNSALGMNAANYQNILAGYQQTAAQQTQAHDAINAGYSGLYNSVLGQLDNQGRFQQGEINDNYAAAVGRGTQDLINRGLGNSTVMSSVARGLEFDRAKAGNDLAERVGRMNADYMSRIGLSNLDFRNNAAQQATGLAGRQLDWMNSVNSPYPDAGLYAQLAAQYGAYQEAQRNRDAMQGGYPGNPPPSGTLSGTYGSPPRGADNIPGVTAPAYGYGMGGGQVGIGAAIAASPDMPRMGGGIEQRDYSPGSYGDMWTDTPSFWQQGYNYLTSQADLAGGWGGGGDFDLSGY